MSKVDLSVFEEFQEALGDDDSLESFVHSMCEGVISYRNRDLKYPEQGDREWGNESWQKELKEFRDAQEKYEADFFSKYGYVHLEQEGGGEGGGEYCYGVFSLGGKTYKAEYSYYSYNGHDYDSILDTLHEVKPVQKVITVYE